MYRHYDSIKQTPASARSQLPLSRAPLVFIFWCVTGSTAVTSHHCNSAFWVQTQDGCALAGVLKQWLSGEVLGFARDLRGEPSLRIRSHGGRLVGGRRRGTLAVEKCDCGRLSARRWASSAAPSRSGEPWGEEPRVPLQTRARAARLRRLRPAVPPVDAALPLSDEDHLRDRVRHRPQAESFPGPGRAPHRTEVRIRTAERHFCHSTLSPAFLSSRCGLAVCAGEWGF